MKRVLILSVCLLLMMACNLTANTAARKTATAPSLTVAPPNPTIATRKTATIQVLTVAPPDPTVESVDIPNATIVYYDIAGTTEQDLRAQLNSLGPVGFDKYKGDATTNWYIKWNWPGYGTDTCDLSAATVSYDIQIIFPRWLPPKNADPDLVVKWTAYIQALATHEKGHVDFVVEHYTSVLEAIHNATCETADADAQTALAPIRQHDVNYDATTSHGATQGARFP